MIAVLVIWFVNVVVFLDLLYVTFLIWLFDCLLLEF